MKNGSGKGILSFLLALGLVTGWGPLALGLQTAEPPGAMTPPPSSPLRQEILHTLRQSLPVAPVVFTVRHLKVAGEWAYIVADPRSPDGRSHYEPVAALLRRQGGKWQPVAFRPCCGECADDPDCADDRRYYRRLRQRYPNAPAAIFPGSGD